MSADFPARVSAAVDTLASPFDAGRIPCPQGGEDRWSARWLMEQMGYDTWENFASVIERAKTAAHTDGFNPSILFRAVTKKTGGRPQTDYLLTRFAAYLTAMNGHTNKPEVAAAQTYFAVKAREAEVAAPRELTEDEIVHQALTISVRRVEALTAKVAELEPPAAAWNELAEAAGDYAVADAAKVLSRDPNIRIGRDRLFAFMQGLRWVYRDNGWRAYQTQVDNGRLTEKVAKPFWHEGRREMVNGTPTVRVTTKGMAELHKRLGGTGQLALVAAS